MNNNRIEGLEIKQYAPGSIIQDIDVRELSSIYPPTAWGSELLGQLSYYYTFTMPTRGRWRTPASFPINIPEDVSKDSLASPWDPSPLVSGYAPIVVIPASPDQDAPDKAPDFRAAWS